MISENTVAIANTIIYEARATFQKFLRPMKLQKLFYFSFGKCLVELKEKITEEHFEAWSYGCVIPSLYYEYKIYGNKYVKHFVYNHNNKQMMMEESTRIYRKIVETLSEYIYLDDMKLSELNHRVKGAWWQTKLHKKNIVNIEDIRKEFQMITK